MAGIFNWSTTAASNTSVGGVSIAEGMSAASVNNAQRATLAEIRTSFDPSMESFFNGTAGLAIAKGGTGATTAAGARTALGALADTYIGAVMNTKSSGFTFSSSDYGKGIRYTGAAATGTIAPSLAVGSVIPIRVAHNASGSLTVSPDTGVTLYLAGATSSATSATFAAGSFGGIFCEAADTWVAWGAV